MSTISGAVVKLTSGQHSTARSISQALTQAAVVLCGFIAVFLILYSFDMMSSLWNGTASVRVTTLALFSFASLLAITLYAWEYLKRFFPVIVGVTLVSLTMEQAPRTIGVIQISLCSLIISLFLWSAIQKLLQQPRVRNLRVLANPWVIIVAVAAAYSIVAMMRHLSLHYTGYDLGIFTQEVYKYAHFEGIYNSVKGQNIFADHFSPFLALLSPVWWIWPSASMLVVVQVVALCLGGWVVYYIAHHMLHDRLISWCITGAYLLAPSLQGPLETDFHEAAFVPLALLLLYYFQQRQKYVGYWITFTLALLIKEDLALYLIAWSIFYGLTTKRWKQAWVGIGISIVYFVFAIKGVMPHFTGTSSYQYFKLGPLGQTPLEVIATIITRPDIALHQFFAFDTEKHFLFPADTKVFTQISLLAVFGFLPLLAPITLIFAAPILAEQFWFEYPLHWGLSFHYATPLTPVLVIATLIALNRIPHHLSRFSLTSPLNVKHIQHIVALFIVTSSFAYSVHHRSFIVNIARPSTYYIGSPERQALALARQIPKGASVATTSSLIPHVAGRSYVITWPGWYGELGADGFKDKPLNTDYALFSFAGSHWFWQPQEAVSHMDMAIYEPGYGLVAMSDDGWTILAQRGAESDPELLSKWEKIKPTLVPISQN